MLFESARMITGLVVEGRVVDQVVLDADLLQDIANSRRMDLDKAMCG